MIYGIVGSRTFFDYFTLENVLDKHIISKIVSGGSKGADSLASRYALERGIQLLEYLPNYNKYGVKAPFIRNKLIVRDAEIIIAFWDLKSGGTKHSLDYAKKLKKKCIIIPF